MKMARSLFKNERAIAQLNNCAFQCHPTPLWQLICTNCMHWCRKYILLLGTYLYYIWCKFGKIIAQLFAGAAPSEGAIRSEFNEQHQHHSTKKVPYLMPIHHFFIRGSFFLLEPQTFKVRGEHFKLRLFPLFNLNIQRIQLLSFLIKLVLKNEDFVRYKVS